MRDAMIPAGYLYKSVVPRPDYFKPEHVTEIWSVSGCLSPEFGDVPWYDRNGYGLFDTPEAMEPFAIEESVDLGAMRLFYYEVFAKAYDEKARAWAPIAIEPESVNVRVPARRSLAGFDIATFSCADSPECSPLSCNGLGQNLAVDAHCLLASFEAAEAALNAGLLDHAEPGPHRIFAVYTLD